ncbi:cytosolic sulfotransferase 12-like [Rutidosis leptorrhynchoides]|uniref:cytosolic sulfotransferase 12-like n=1 Tax=Rutidosis leptorrhynchoides TaxID=125765 RepID=UPI003A99C9B6
MQTSNVSLPIYLIEDDTTQECKSLISSLPKETGWVVSSLYNYQGFWHPSRQLQGVLSCQKHFEAQESDILLVTTPKSGTTWLKAIVFSLINRTRFSQTINHHPLLSNNPHILVPFLELKLYVDNENPDLSCLTSPRLFSTHLPFVSLPNSVLDSHCKVVYMCRDPKDTFVSLWAFANKLRLKEMGTNSLEEVLDKFCRGVSLYGPFWDHVLGYWNESLINPEKVFFLKYEEMKEQPEFHLKKLADFLGCSFSSKEIEENAVEGILNICSFDNLSNLKVNKEGKLPSGENSSAFFRKGEVGDWKNHLTAEMAKRVDNICDEKFDGSGLKF